MLKTLVFSALLIASTISAGADPSQDAYRSGLKSAKAGDLKQATQQFEKAAKLNPSNFLALFDLGGAYEALHQPDQALPCYLKAVAAKPEFAEAEVEVATLYMLHKKDLDGALAHYKKAILQRRPYVDSRFPEPRTRGQALLNVGVIYAEKQQVGVAVGVARSLLAHPAATKSKNVNVLLQRCEAGLAKNMSARDYASELKALDAQLNSNPRQALAAYEAFQKKHKDLGTALDQWQFFDGIGLACAMTGQMERARIYFEKASKFGEGLEYGKWQESVFNQACALASTGHAEPALKHLDTVLWIDAVTRFDPKGKAKRYLEKIPKDDSLKSLRGTKELQQLLERYKH